ARLGWSHGDEEVFTRAQLVEWFDLEHVSKSPARWDPEKLRWMNAEYLKGRSNGELVEELRQHHAALYERLAAVMDVEAMTAAGRAHGPDPDPGHRRHRRRPPEGRGPAKAGTGGLGLI